MPGFDKTGPGGQGPMTGGGRGFCAEPVPGRPTGRRFFGLGWRRRGGAGWGRGRGRGRGFWPAGLAGWRGWPFFGAGGPDRPNAEEELAIMKEEAEGLKQNLTEVQNRIDALEKEKSK